MPVIITAETEQGGAVILNEGRKIYASYAVAGVADLPRPGILYSGGLLPDGRKIEFFLNADTGLVVIDIIDKKGKGGTEILRKQFC